jgi:hypothetical protein
VDVVDRVARDLEQPTRERPFSTELGQALQRVREDLAGHVLARVRVGDPQAQVAEHPLDIAVVEREERPRVEPRRRHELGVGVDEPHARGLVLERAQLHHSVTSHLSHRP